MKTIANGIREKQIIELLKPVLVLIILILAWPLVQMLLFTSDQTTGYVDPSILILIVLSLICFIGMVGLSGWLFIKALKSVGLPIIGNMVSQFNTMAVWQQIGFYYASYALLLLAGVGCLVAVL
ncbi:MAG: hypothetical protein WKF66_10275 [Pedobacter sp.]